MKKVSPQQIRKFRTTIYSHYRRHGRSLPWRPSSRVRSTVVASDPYKILVSEIMLQQTQVERVIPMFKRFIRACPDIASLSRARQSRVLSLWQGLGYNRRAVALKKCAEIVMRDYQGELPCELEKLKQLPGVGHHTASAVLAFAFNKHSIFIETNIRSVFIHHFFSGKNNVSDSDLHPLIAATLDRKNPRQWYAALMDYGTYLKQTVTNPGRRSAHYVRQSPFVGSNRELRGLIVRLLLQKRNRTVAELSRFCDDSRDRIVRNIRQLQKEGMIKQIGERYTIA